MLLARLARPTGVGQVRASGRPPVAKPNREGRISNIFDERNSFLAARRRPPALERRWRKRFPMKSRTCVAD
eukprot:9472527-Pyramimonas_sp.AAC.1